jgi:hypothetical protein
MLFYFRKKDLLVGGHGETGDADAESREGVEREGVARGSLDALVRAFDGTCRHVLGKPAPDRLGFEQHAARAGSPEPV